MGSVLRTQHSIRVYAEDVDFMGIVYHANYLCYLERARTELLRENNLQLSEVLKLDIFFAITQVVINYKLPAKLDDLLLITTEIIKVKACSFVFCQKIVNGDNKLVAEAEVQVVCVDNNLRPKRLPDQLRPN